MEFQDISLFVEIGTCMVGALSFILRTIFLSLHLNTMIPVSYSQK